MKTMITLALALSVSTVIAQTNPDAQRTAGNPIGGIIVKGGHNGLAVSDAQPANPVYTAPVGEGTNPLAKTAGQPIGGIIVKGGSNVAPAQVTSNPLYKGDGATGNNPLYKGNARTTGQPIGGIVVKGGQNGLAQNTPSSDGGVTTNPLYEGSARTAGSPIGGIVVKGGQNPTRFELSNPIPSIGVVVKHNIADRVITYTNDEQVEDATLLNALKVSQLIIKKGVYPIDADNRVTLQIEKIVHRDIAARSLQLQGYDEQTQTSFDYSVEPVTVNGEMTQIIITYKSINEKGVK